MERILLEGGNKRAGKSWKYNRVFQKAASTQFDMQLMPSLQMKHGKLS